MGCGHSRRIEMEFFAKEIKPLISNLMEINGLIADDAYKLFLLFTSLDKNKDGTLSCSEFHKLLTLKITQITERQYLNMNGAKNDLSFAEFVQFVCKLKKTEVGDLAEFAFNIFDVDRNKSLSIYEIDALLRMVTDKEEAESHFLQHLHTFFDGEHISKESFIKGIEEKPAIFKLLLEVQEKLRAVLEN